MFGTEHNPIEDKTHRSYTHSNISRTRCKMDSLDLVSHSQMIATLHPDALRS